MDFLYFIIINLLYLMNYNKNIFTENTVKLVLLNNTRFRYKDFEDLLMEFQIPF